MFFEEILTVLRRSEVDDLFELPDERLRILVANSVGNLVDGAIFIH